MSVLECGEPAKYHGNDYQRYRVYGVSGTKIRDMIRTIVPVHEEGPIMFSRRCGEIRVTSALKGGDLWIPDCGGGATDGEAALCCLGIVVALLAVVAVVWAVVMIVFSVVSWGGFFKRRFRTFVFLERHDEELIRKLAVAVAMEGGVLRCEIGEPSFDMWARDTLSLYLRLKRIRQASLLLGAGWGWVEVLFKARNIIDPSFHYNLWPFRFVMVLVFLPLIFCMPVLEMSFRSTARQGLEVAERLAATRPEYNPKTRLPPKIETTSIGGGTDVADDSFRPGEF